MFSENSDQLDPSELIASSNCPICQGNSKVLLHMDTINPKSKDQVALRQCTACNHWWHDPRPKQKYLSRLYERDSEFVVSLTALPKLHRPDYKDLARFAGPVLDDFKDRPSFNYLEIGSGSGYLLDFFSIFAEKSYGVEPSRQSERTNVAADIDNLPSDVKFDCIVIQDVLEHISDPLDMLKKIKNTSNPGAFIYAGFPRGDSWKARILKNRWSMMRPVGHLHYFSSESITKIFDSAGWKIVNKRPARLGDMNVWEILKWFPYREKNLIYRLGKSLVVGQLFLGKDQWKVKAKIE